MERITVTRYEPGAVHGWLGQIAPESNRWIIFVDEANTPQLYFCITVTRDGKPSDMWMHAKDVYQWTSVNGGGRRTEGEAGVSYELPGFGTAGPPFDKKKDLG